MTGCKCSRREQRQRGLITSQCQDVTGYRTHHNSPFVSCSTSSKRDKSEGGAALSLLGAGDHGAGAGLERLLGLGAGLERLVGGESVEGDSADLAAGAAAPGSEVPAVFAMLWKKLSNTMQHFVMLCM